MVKPAAVAVRLLFLNKNIKDDIVLLNCESGINFSLMHGSISLQGIFKPSIFIIMNYLAHAYLSFNKPGILVGNMISDYIKGKKQFDYPLPVQKGIRLHRAIDNYTDTHAATKELKSYFSRQYRLYSGAFADVVYDHFLANDTNEFSNEAALQTFAANTYHLLEAHTALFPQPFLLMFPYMKEQDWLYNYRTRVAIKHSFAGVVRRSAYLTESAVAFALFNEFYGNMQLCYDAFFPDLKKYTLQQLEELLNTS